MGLVIAPGDMIKPLRIGDVMKISNNLVGLRTLNQGHRHADWKTNGLLFFLE